MTIEQAIEKAIEGGYENEKLFTGEYPYLPNGYCDLRISFNGNVSAQRCRKDGEGGRWVRFGNTSDFFLDPTFWQSLGKAMGWGHIHGEFCDCPGFVWLEEWHRFIDHLAKGKDAESFFSNL